MAEHYGASRTAFPPGTLERLLEVSEAVWKVCAKCGADMPLDKVRVTEAERKDDNPAWICSDCAPPEVMQREMLQAIMTSHISEEMITAYLDCGIPKSVLWEVVAFRIVQADGPEAVNVGKYTTEVANYLVNTFIPKHGLAAGEAGEFFLGMMREIVTDLTIVEMEKQV